MWTSPASLLAWSDASLRCPLLLLQFWSGVPVCAVESITSESVGLHWRSLRCLPLVVASSSTPAHVRSTNVGGGERHQLVRWSAPVLTPTSPSAGRFFIL